MDLENFTDVLGDGDSDEIANSQPLSLSLSLSSNTCAAARPIFQKTSDTNSRNERPARHTGQQGEFRSVEEIDEKYRDVFTYPYFNLVQSRVIDDALYSDKSMVVCAPTGSGKTVIFEMAIVQLLMDLNDKNYTGDFKIIYMAPVKALCTERLSEWYPKFTKLGLMCIEVTGDTAVDFSQLKPYKIIITTPEKWDILTRRWRDHKSLVEVIKLFLIDEVHILNDATRGPVLEAVVSRMKTIEASSQTAHRIEQLQKQYQTIQKTPSDEFSFKASLPVRIRFIAVSATISNPDDVAEWLGASDKPAVYHKFGDECRPVKLKRVVEGYPCAAGTSIFKFDIILNYKLWPIIQKYHDGKPTLIFCNTRKSVAITADTLSRELTISFTPEQQAKLSALASTIKNKKLQALVMSGVGCHHAGLLFEERLNIEAAFRNRHLPILITTTTLAMGVNLPAHLVIIKNTQQYVNGAYQEYSISTVLQMVGRAGRPQFDTEATAVIMTRLQDKPRYQALVGGDEPLQSYLHKRLPENLNSEAALGTVCDVAQCVQWLRSTFLSVRAAKDPKRYLSLPPNAHPALISKKIEELCVKAMNGLATFGLITMDEASCIESTETGRLMSFFYVDLETMKHIMKIEGSETLEKLLWIVCESHELADMHLRVDERRTLNLLNRNNSAATIRFPMKGKISTRQMKLNCIIQAILGCLPIPDPSLNQEAMKVMRIADRVCKCLVAYVTRPDVVSSQPQYYTAIINAVTLTKCVEAHMWENSPYVCKQLKGIGPTFSSLLASAGKVNFTLLEGSHPRDLERIMNKGAPAGNVLRKQISFLPKYQLTATPIDEKRISIQLLLVNQHHLVENRDELTAGESHKCYVVVGDSENYLLLFTSFKDKDLINVYDGTITYEITRKHNFEHRIVIQCISSNWVGIDAQCDYLFKNIEPAFLRGETLKPNLTVNAANKPKNQNAKLKQTSITDTYKERKRKNDEIYIIESKEKKKRDTALVEKIKNNKNSLNYTSKELRENLDKSAQMSNLIIKEMKNSDKNEQAKTNRPTDTLFEKIDQNALRLVEKINLVDSNNSRLTPIENNGYDFSKIEELDDEENYLVNDHINSIMIEIESEIFKSNYDTAKCANMNVKMTQNPECEDLNPSSHIQSSFIKKSLSKTARTQAPGSFPKPVAYSMMNEKSKRKPLNTKTNYSFIDAIENNVNMNSDDDIPPKESGFSDTIKTQLEKFLHRTAKSKDDPAVKELLRCAEFTEQVVPKQELGTPKMMTDEYLSTENNTSLSLELPAISASGHQLKQYNEEKKSIDNAIANVQNIGKLVEKIEHEYNISTKETNKVAKGQVTTNFEKTPFSLMLYGTNVKSKSPEKHMNNFKTTENKLNECQNKSKVAKNIIICEDEKTAYITNSNTKTSNITNHNTLVPIDYLVSNDESGKLIKDVSVKPSSSSFISDKEVTKYANTGLFNEKMFNTSSITSQMTSCPVASSSRLFMVVSNKNPLESSKINLEDNNVYNQNVKVETARRTPSTTTTSERHGNINCTQITEIASVSKTSTTGTRSNVSFHKKNQNTANSENEHSYISRYSISATKVDVCTKTLPEHEVHIIRKLKLGLDVTEIVSERKSKYSKETNDVEQEFAKYYHTKTDNRNLQNQRYLKSDWPVTDMQYLGTNEVEAEKNTRFDTRYSIIDSQRINGQTIDKSDRHNTPDKQKNCSKPLKHILDYHETTELIRNNEQHLPEIEKYFEKEVHNMQELENDKTKYEDVEQYKNYLREIARAKVFSTPEKTKTISTAPERNDTVFQNVDTEKNKIEKDQKCNDAKHKIGNILKKYNGILRKSNNTINKGAGKNSVITCNNLKSSKKFERPYKISDIQNLHVASLPKLALEASYITQSSTNILPENIDEQMEDNHPRKINSTPEDVNFGNSMNVNFVYMDDNLPESIPSPVTDIPQEEFTHDYDLDQSMLNPKILLEQCFSKEEINYYEDDEMIPPPLEFCDDALNQADRLDELSAYSQENHQLEQIPNMHEHNQSIFKDNHSVFTPSVEIETWTQSCDEDNGTTMTDRFHSNLFKKRNSLVSGTESDDFRQMHTQHNLKSVTVMRKNSVSNLVLDSKDSKLARFQFRQKKKLRM